ncbi:uncharacterized protein involved in cysteine biosynthesis [Balneicella halophila]|uniref:Uncharacterized protein involved in cysteine biosynthesis n=1 Tax=Balneicella halophila TaxID=1537566 RepID=A0A7L4USK3_BALHA|nr:EI24 domain-containing protein [Balneicella halophila]PVX51964.1 uncharacterized protein involved in cysteine biosynthesis [Balneicella halophila]
MKAFREFGLAIQCYNRGFKLLFHKKIRLFLFIPIVINILLIVGGYSLITNFTDGLSEKIFQLTGAENLTFWGSAYFDELIYGIFYFTFNVLFILSLILYGGFLIIIIMSPFFSIISERIESLETGVDYPFSIKKALQDIWRGIKITVRNAVVQLLLSVVIFIIGFIPILGAFAPILLFVTSSFFYGASFMDFGMERHYPTIRESISFIRQHRVATFGVGALFALSLFLPLCNLFLAAFVAIWSVIAGTLVILKIQNKQFY